MRNGYIWPQEQTDLLTILWAGGYSASQIASQIAEHLGTVVTRNAVIGKVHRLDLPPRTTTSRKQCRCYERKPRISAVVPPAEKRRGAVANGSGLSAPPKYHSRFPIELGTGCRWPHGHPGDADFGFCGEKRCSHGWGSYCESHYRDAYLLTPRMIAAAGGLPDLHIAAGKP